MWQIVGTVEVGSTVDRCGQDVWCTEGVYVDGSKTVSWWEGSKRGRGECRCEQDFWWVGTVVVEERFVLETDLDVAGVTICTWPELTLV